MVVTTRAGLVGANSRVEALVRKSSPADEARATTSTAPAVEELWGNRRKGLGRYSEEADHPATEPAARARGSATEVPTLDLQ
jgi:hypothetical protein